MKIFQLLCFVLMLASCSSFKNMLGMNDEINKPTPLKKLKNLQKITKIWKNTSSSGIGKEGHKLIFSFTGTQLVTLDHKGRIIVYDQTLKKLWRKKIKGLAAGPGVADDLIVVVGAEGVVIALASDDGRTVWQYPVAREVLAVPVIAETVVIIRTIDGQVLGLDKRSGKRLWAYQSKVPVLSLRGTGKPLLIDGKIFVGFANGELASLEASDGELQWLSKIGLSHGRTEVQRMIDVDTDPVAHDGVIIVSAYQGATVAVIVASGTILWKKKDLSTSTGSAIDVTQVYVTDEKSNVWALDRDNGATLWKQADLQYRKLTAPVVYEGGVVVGDFEGYLHWLDKDSGQFLARLKIDSSGISEKPVIVDGRLFVYANDGTLMVLELE